MNIALDWDGTFAADIPAFTAVAAVLRACGHNVFIVTARHEHEPVTPPQGMLVYYTGRRAKAAFMQDMGISVDIWTDDDPMHVLQDHA